MELFQGNGQLDEDVEDILYELGNVGVGMVSTTIGSMLGVRAEIGIPGMDVQKQMLGTLWNRLIKSRLKR